MRAGDRLENPVTGERAIVRVGSDDTGGDHALCDLYVRPGGRVALPHLHPHLTENFEVLEGRLDLILGRHHAVVHEGETVTIPPGTVHDWWNGGDREAHVLVEVRGDGVARFEMLIATMWGLGRDGKTNAKGVPHPLQLAVVAHEFSDVFRAAKPPWIIQRILLAVLAPIGRALGYPSTYGTMDGPTHASPRADR
jgi:mannose-6-phosphate isomerase-like protein (cupin superfamily)